MARRRDIRDAVYDELVDAATGEYTVTFDDGSTTDLEITEDEVDLANPENRERVPGVFYQPQASVHREFNGVGNGPDEVVLNDDGSVDYVTWVQHIEDFYLLYVRAQTPAHREPVYESVYRQFEKYEQTIDESNLHSDIEKIWIEESNPANSPEEENAIWGDQIALYVRWKRNFIVESGGSMTMDEAVDAVENITTVELETDADMDTETSGLTYTIE